MRSDGWWWLPVLLAACLAGAELLSWAGTRGEPPEVAAGRKAAAVLEPLHTRKGPPRRGDWLASQNEQQQSFEDYVADAPNRPDAKRTTLYILPLVGRLDAPRKRLVNDAGELSGLVLGVPVKMLEPIDPADVPERFRRAGRGYGEQIDASWVLGHLQNGMSDDALGVIAISTADLWPGNDWNFVFGMGRPEDHVAVWSLARYGDPARNYQQVSERTMKIAAHEAAQMAGLHHCVDWECGMNGCMNLEEFDRIPMTFCQECERKLWWAARTDPAARFARLAEFAESHNLPSAARMWRASEALLRSR